MVEHVCWCIDTALFLASSAEESDYAMSDSAIFSSAPQRGRHSNQLTGMFSMDLDENSISNSKNLDLIVATMMLVMLFLIFYV